MTHDPLTHCQLWFGAVRTWVEILHQPVMNEIRNGELSDFIYQTWMADGVESFREIKSYQVNEFVIFEKNWDLMYQVYQRYYYRCYNNNKWRKTPFESLISVLYVLYQVIFVTIKLLKEVSDIRMSPFLTDLINFMTTQSLWRDYTHQSPKGQSWRNPKKNQPASQPSSQPSSRTSQITSAYLKRQFQFPPVTYSGFHKGWGYLLPGHYFFYKEGQTLFSYFFYYGHGWLLGRRGMAECPLINTPLILSI